jgi:uncharacterized protein (TIGR03067 family)
MRKEVALLFGAVCLVAVAGLLRAADEQKDKDKDKEKAIKEERKKYAGTWTVTSLTVDGQEASEEDCQKITVENEADGKWTIKIQGNTIAKGTSKIDPTKKPKAYDFTPSEGPNKDQTSLGIYELGKDTRKLCYAPPGKDRPTKFSAESGSGHTLVTFKRESD